jgi:hypothetical protein
MSGKRRRRGKVMSPDYSSHRRTQPPKNQTFNLTIDRAWKCTIGALLASIACMKLWKIITAYVVIVSVVGCQSSAKMTALDRSLVKKKITPTASGGIQIEMDGTFIHNPTAAIETFHTVAEKSMAGRPYRYSYSLDHKQRAVTQPIASTNSGSGGVYTPIFVPANSGSGEAAIILGSIALIILLAKMASDSRAPAATIPGQPTTTLASDVKMVTTRILKITGTAEPISPVTLDRNRLLTVRFPDQPPVIGKLKPEVAKALAEEVRKGFESLGCKVLLGNQPNQGGYTVTTNVLRAQGNAIKYSSLTIEMTLSDHSTGREVARWIVQGNEKPFDMPSQNERLYGPGIATGILRKPMLTQMSRYLR